ncbi:MAG: DegT/DnrJ/EryC1/StrS family aminotransferase [Mucilaginibacter sp.]|jgi:dTDP-4-amino-4,6-dideoxygalactose transaminase|uniref:DegT/DnrJ/EryC1/StrS family aminotransferase n=1 Tax=Mucilaginibacter sp. TaxID=1882438 RepID=UPI00356ACBAF
MHIPFSPPYIDQAVIDEVTSTLTSNWITTGPKVAAFETELKTMTSSKAVICVNSWTSGAILILKWFGIKPGDEVIVPAYTYCATALAVLHCGATPVMVDIEDDFCISASAVRKAITPKTKAIIAVDIAGLPCDYNALMGIVSEPGIQALFIPESAEQNMLNRVLLIADAAHSIGAKYRGRPSATASDIAIFSFHAVKNITTAEGGAICLNLPVVFDHEALYRFLKIYTLNGQNKDALAKSLGAGWRYDVLFAGLKINMPDICASVGLAQLRKYETDILPRRKQIANSYAKGFEHKPWAILPCVHDENRESSYHLYPIRIKGIDEKQRDLIIDAIVAEGVAVNVHFIPMPMLTCFKSKGFKIQDYPSSYTNYACEISLPIYPQLTDNEVDFIVAVVSNAVEYELTCKKVFATNLVINLA